MKNYIGIAVRSTVDISAMDAVKVQERKNKILIGQPMDNNIDKTISLLLKSLNALSIKSEDILGIYSFLA